MSLSASYHPTAWSRFQAEPPPPPAKKRYVQSYKMEWESEEDFRGWLSKSVQGEEFGYCVPCNKHIKVSAGGKNDLRDHGRGEKHKKLFAEFISKVDYFTVSSVENDMTQAELHWARLVAENHLPFTLASHLSDLFRNMFTDSEIASKFSCSENKTRSLVVDSLGDHLLKSVLERMRCTHFSLLIDRGHGYRPANQVTVVVRLLDEQGQVRSYFYKVLEVKEGSQFSGYSFGSTALLRTILDELQSSNVPLEHLMGFGLDAVHYAEGEGQCEFSHFKAELPHLFNAHYLCHAAHQLANDACVVFPDEVQTLPVRIWFHLKKCAENLQTLPYLQDFVDTKQHKSLRPAQGRWLSLQNVVQTMAEHWCALKYFFEASNEESAMVIGIRDNLRSELAHLCFLFLNYSLPVLLNFSLLFQQHIPNLHTFHQELQLMYKELMGRFINPRIIEGAPSLLSIDVTDEKNYLPCSQIDLGGEDCKSLLLHLETEGDVGTVSTFLSIAGRFWVEACLQIQRHLPLDDSDDLIYRSLEALDPKNRMVSKDLFMKLAGRFPNIIENNDNLLEQLEDEALEYELMVIPEDKTALVVDEYWNYIKMMKNPRYPGKYRLPLLSKLASALLVLPHGSAVVEMIFNEVSTMKLKDTDCSALNTLNGVLQISCSKLEENCLRLRKNI